MRYQLLLSLMVLGSGVVATEFSPWFPPPFEFQADFAALYERNTEVTSPIENFSYLANNFSLHESLDVTLWPNWNMEVELYLTHTRNVTFGYEAALVTLRYAWYDDVCGDFATVVTGATLSFPNERFLHNFTYAYHGTINAELHTTIGKEWADYYDWYARFWALGGIGIANKGSAWVHAKLVAACKLDQIEYALFAEGIAGLGNENIIPDVPFEGYGPIAHRSIDLGAWVRHPHRCDNTLEIMGWYNVYARNFSENAWGIQVSYLIPFSF